MNCGIIAFSFLSISEAVADASRSYCTVPVSIPAPFTAQLGSSHGHAVIPLAALLAPINRDARIADAAKLIVRKLFAEHAATPLAAANAGRARGSTN